ncbi:DExH-box splicing factor binding site-domain-containing protein, partial [Boeremia exigua]|uniref:DExH-box splicing factor binding site-domain-containing protein n=1 Tax=Boeremia exigua TaxID=749465 RepID=UPI001E8E6188
MAAGGFKMSLGGLKAKPGLKGVIAKGNTKPKKALLGDDEPEDANKAQEIAGFDAAEGGAIDINGPKEKKGPLVIPSLPNRNWREEARKKQLERAPHTQQQQNGDVVMEEPEKEIVYGLTVPTKPSSAQETNPTPAPEAMDVDPNDALTPAQRLDNQALEALLTGSATDTARIVPAISDEEALAADLLDAPDAPSLDAYEATPIEGFGLAMLRGMGWKDSDGEARSGKAPAEVKRRPALLGIGAKADAAKDVELGEFNSKARGKKGRDAPAGYNPVSLRNKKTGEVVSEEELKRKLEGQELVGEEKGGRRDDRDRERRDDRDREKRDDRGRDDKSRRDDKPRRDRHRDSDYD